MRNRTEVIVLQSLAKTADPCRIACAVLADMAEAASCRTPAIRHNLYAFQKRSLNMQDPFY